MKNLKLDIEHASNLLLESVDKSWKDKRVNFKWKFMFKKFIKIFNVNDVLGCFRSGFALKLPVMQLF